MTQQEQQMLQGLTDRVNQTQLTDKDPQAEQFLTQSLGRNPDALYILAQTVLVTQYGLEQAQKQVAELRQQLEQAPQQAPQRHTSFLGGLLGHDDPPPPPPPQFQPVPNYPQGYPAQPSYAGQPYPMAPPQYGPPAGYAAGPFGGQPAGGGFLQSALRTATGVAAGAFAFEGIESLMHGFGRGGGYGMGGFGGGQEEIVNNYYGDRGANDFSSRLSNDIEDRRGDNAAYEERSGGQDLGAAAGADFSQDDSQGFADTSTDKDDSGSSFDMGSDDGNS